MKPNILLVVLDATRADRCSSYGYHRPTTPVLDTLAAQGTLFENAFSVAPWTMPALASLLTGRYPSEHHAYELLRLSSHWATLAELLEVAGYATMVVTNNSWLSDSFGTTRGFQTIIKLWQLIQTSQDITRLSLDQTLPNGSLFSKVVGRIIQGNPLHNVINAAYGRLWRNRTDYGARRLNQMTQQWISGQEKPWFVLAHYLEAHLEYRPPHREWAKFVRHKGTAQRLLASDQMRMMWRHVAGVQLLRQLELETWSDLYDAEVNYQDTCLGELLAWLDEMGQLDNTLVIITADHGENLGEHGLLNHQYCLYDTLLHVPLVIRYPAAFPAGKRVKEPVTLLDVFATVLDIAEGDATANAHGISLTNEEVLANRPHTLAEYGAPRPPDETALARYEIPRGNLLPFEQSLTAIRSGTHKLIVSSNGTIELYDWLNDPGETQNLASQQPTIAESLSFELACYQTMLASEEEFPFAGEVPGIDPKVIARLHDLGYID